MATLLLSRSPPPEAKTLAAIARQLRWNVQWLGRRHAPTHLHGQDLALYAPTDVALRVAQRHDLALLEPTLGILATLPECYTSRQIRFTRLGNAEVLDRPMFGWHATIKVSGRSRRTKPTPCYPSATRY